jgi:hypothetical protein
LIKVKLLKLEPKTVHVSFWHSCETRAVSSNLT